MASSKMQAQFIKLITNMTLMSALLPALSINYVVSGRSLGFSRDAPSYAFKL